MPRGGNLKNRSVDQTGRTALKAWPKPPKDFNAGEVVAWRKLGVAAMAAGSFAASDMLLAQRLAQLSARVDAAMLDPTIRTSTWTALTRLETDMRKLAGLTPQSRSTVGALARPRVKTAMDEFDVNRFDPGFDPLAD